MPVPGGKCKPCVGQLGMHEAPASHGHSTLSSITWSTLSLGAGTGLSFTNPKQHAEVRMSFGSKAGSMLAAIPCAAAQPTWVRDVADVIHVMLKRPETAGKTFCLGGPEVLR